MSVRWFAVVALVTATVPAGADDATEALPPRERAARLLTDGTRLYKQGDHAGALDAFQRAYAAYPSPGLELDIGTTLRAMGKNVEAANAYQRYLDDPQADPKLVAEVTTVLGVLDATLGRLAIETESGAEIEIGDGPWLAGKDAHLVRVDPGTFVVRARHEPRDGVVTGRVAPGRIVPVVVSLQAPVAPISPMVTHHDEPSISAPASRRPWWPRAVWIGSAGVAATALVGGTVLAVQATHGYSDARALCGSACGGDSHARAVELAGDADRDRAWSFASFTVATAALVAGGIVWFRDRHSDHAPAISVAVSPGGIAITGGF